MEVKINEEDLIHTEEEFSIRTTGSLLLGRRILMEVRIPFGEDIKILSEVEIPLEVKIHLGSSKVSDKGPVKIPIEDRHP